MRLVPRRAGAAAPTIVGVASHLSRRGGHGERGETRGVDSRGEREGGAADGDVKRRRGERGMMSRRGEADEDDTVGEMSDAHCCCRSVDKACMDTLHRPVYHENMMLCCRYMAA